MSLALEARQFLRSTQSGMLSTFSSKFLGYPFGSVAPFILDHEANPIVLISTIAEHTKNIIANPKVSLLVFAGHEDLQASARLTLMGEASQIEKTDTDSTYANLQSRYLRYLPEAASYFATHDFSFYRINISQARYIAGFGKMGWMDGSELTSSMLNTPQTTHSVLAEQETSIIEHMNADHKHSMIAYCQYFHHVSAISTKMLGVDYDGFDIQATMTDGQIETLRFSVKEPISDAQSARAALVAMSQLCKDGTR